MEIQTFMLANGIRLVHRSVTGKVSHCGIFINAGSRDEMEDEHGIAHLIEHTVFKRTTKRNVFQILNRLENIGADMNAFTGKEDTCIYASFLNQYYERTLELFQDIFFHAVFPEKEIEKEKQVVLDEIQSYLDTPSEQIFDDFEDFFFQGHPLGKNILGSAKSLKKIKRENILQFILRKYQMKEIVIASVGNIPFARLIKLAIKYFSEQPERNCSLIRKPVTTYYSFQKQLKKKTFQVHCILGFPAYRFSDERRIPLALLNNMLGGPVMNSRLSLALRERNGLTYHNESNYTPYSDSGIISIYFGTDPLHYAKAMEIISKELKRLRTEKLSKVQLHTVQKQLIGQLAIAQESKLSAMLAMGKSYLLQNSFDPIENVVKKIEAVTSEVLLDISNDIFHPSTLSFLTFLPK